MNQLNACIVRITDATGKILGTGFLLTADGRVATCYHVVEHQEEICIAFPGEEPSPARLIVTDSVHDVAILQVKSDLPPEAKPSSLGPSSVADGLLFYSRGYRPLGGLEGIPAEGKVLGTVSEVPGCPKVHHMPLVLQSQHVRGGMSGAPVYVPNLDRVVGMITAYWDSLKAGTGFSDRDTVLATPAEAIAALCPDIPLEESVKSGPALSSGIQTIDALKRALDRLADGSYTTTDIANLQRALQTGQISIVTRERAVGGDVNDTVIVTGDGNVVHVYTGVDAEIIRQLFSQMNLATPQEVQRLINRYRESIGEMCCYLDIAETPLPPSMAVRVELQRIYTKLRSQIRGSPMTIGQVLNRTPHPKLIVVGESGAGKSVLLRFLTKVYALREAHDTLWVPESENDVLPFLFKLRECSNPDDLWEQVLARAVRGFLPSTLDVAQKALEEQASKGNAFLLLDGLDEILDSHKRMTVLQVLQRMTYAYPSLRIIVTSRPFERSLGLQNFELLEITSLPRVEIPTFVEYWLKALVEAGAFSASEVEYRKSSFLAKVENIPHLQDLASNPFSLTILVLLVGFEGIDVDFPQSWLQLLRRYLQFYWWWETERRGLKAPMRKSIMWEGLYLTCYYLKAVSPYRDQVLGELLNFLKMRYSMSPLSASDASEEILSFWIRTGMLHYNELEDRLYVKHSIFQKYGIAQALNILPEEMWRHSPEVYSLPEWMGYIQWASIIKSRRDDAQ